MSGKPPPASKNSLSKTQLPPFVEMLDVSQKDIIKNLWNVDDLSISDKIDSIDWISKEMPKEARVEYRKWRFLVDRSRMPDFYNSQNEEIKMVIAEIFKEFTDLEEFARAIMNIKPVLNNPDAFDKWIENEEIEFREPPIQEAMKRESTSQSIATTTTDPTRNNLSVKTITSETNKNPNICDAIAIDIGTSKCRISICKDKYIQIVEHESSRSVPSCVAYSEQDEWLVGRITENYAVCLQNVIYDIRWLLGKKNGEINRVQDKKRYFFRRSEHLRNDGIATFDMIDQGKDKPSEVVDAKKIFEYLLGPLFATAYKNFQHPTNIVITVPIKSTQDYKNSVEDCARSAMSSSTATQNIKLIDETIAVAAAYAPKLNLHSKGDLALVFCMGAGYLQVAAYFIQEKTHQEKVNWTDLIITQMPEIEPIVENFAGDDIDRLVFDNMMEKLTQQNGGSRPKISTRAERRLKIACEKMKCALSFAPHTRIDVDSLYRSGDEDRDLVAVIQKDEIVKYYNKEVEKIIKDVWKAYKELKPKFILLAGGSTRLPVITEYLTREFPESTICNFLNVDEVAAIGAVAIVSKTVTVAEKFISYKEVIEIIEGQEKEKKERRNPPSTSTLAARSNQATELTQTARISTPAARPTPADDTPILSKSGDQDNKSSEVVIKDYQYSPVKSAIQNSHTPQDNRSEHPNISYPQPKQSQSVSPTGSSSDSRGKSDRNGKLGPDAVDGMQNRGAEASRDIRRNSSPQRSHDNGFTNDQSEQRSQSLKNNSYDRPQSPTNCLSLNSGKINHNSQDQKPIPSTLTVENKKFDNKYAGSTSSNPMNTGNPSQQNQEKLVNRHNEPPSSQRAGNDQDDSIYNKWIINPNPNVCPYMEINLKNLRVERVNTYLIEPATLDGICTIDFLEPHIGQSNTLRYSPFYHIEFNCNVLRLIKIKIYDPRQTFPLDQLNIVFEYRCVISAVCVNRGNVEYTKSWDIYKYKPIFAWRESKLLINLDSKF